MGGSAPLVSGGEGWCFHSYLDDEGLNQRVGIPVRTAIVVDLDVCNDDLLGEPLVIVYADKSWYAESL